MVSFANGIYSCIFFYLYEDICINEKEPKEKSYLVCIVQEQERLKRTYSKNAIPVNENCLGWNPMNTRCRTCGNGANF